MKKVLLGMALALLLAVTGCTGGRGAPPPAPGLLATEWREIQEACALEDGSRAVIQNLSFAVDPAGREVTSLQIYFEAQEGGEVVAYAATLDQEHGYLISRSPAGPALGSIVTEDVRLTVDEVLAAVDRLGPDLIAPPGGGPWNFNLRVAVEQGRVYGLGGTAFFGDSFDETYLMRDGRAVKLAAGETAVVSGVNATLQAWMMPAPEGREGVIKSRQFILSSSEKVERVGTVKQPVITKDEHFLAARYADLDGDGRRSQVYLVGWASEPGSYFPDRRRLVVHDGPKPRQIELPDSQGFQGTDFRLRDLNNDGKLELMLFDIVGGSGGIVELNILALEGDGWRPLFSSREAAIQREMYNEYLGDNRVRVAVPLFGRAWEYGLEPPRYGTPLVEIDEQDVYPGFARDWADPFSSYALERRADGTVAVAGQQVVCGIAHADVVGLLQHTFVPGEWGYESAGLELYRPTDAGYAKVTPLPLLPKERRLITRETGLVFPVHAPRETLRTLTKGAVIEVLDQRTFDGSPWVFTRVNVYDTPLHYHGWIKAADTVPVTRENARQAREVYIRDGTEVYQVWEFERVKDTRPGTWHETVAFIQDRRDGMVLLGVAGGASFWTKEENIVYPEPLE